jgi:hypothetical protein
MFLHGGFKAIGVPHDPKTKLKKNVNKCRNPNLGLVTKARACKGAGQV